MHPFEEGDVARPREAFDQVKTRLLAVSGPAGARARARAHD